MGTHAHRVKKPPHERMTRRQAAKLLTSMPGLGTVHRSNLRPGDVLVMTAPGHISLENAKELRARLEKFFPGHEIIVIGDGLRLKVIRNGKAIR